MSRIYISSGHHLSDPGASYGPYTESLICMKIRDEVAKLMPDAIFVPDSFTLRQTIDWINETCKPEDLALEIHLNFSNDQTRSGCEVYYSKEPEIATIFAKHVAKTLQVACNGAKPDSQSFVGSLGFLRQIGCHTALLECAYLSHPGDRLKIVFPSGQMRVAEGIKNGIMEWRGEIETYRTQLNSMLKLLQELLKKYYGKI